MKPLLCYNDEKVVFGMNRKIGVLDSGIGGLTVLEQIKKILPTEDYVYYADGKNNPYGEKTPEEIYDIVDKIVRRLICKENCKLIVIACNTATTRCMNKLKKEYPDVLFVGIVPAIKAACDHGSLHTLVLATTSTIHSEWTKKLVRDNKRESQEIVLLSCSGLASAIEVGDKYKIHDLLQNVKTKVQGKNIDSIVLGCTHYVLIKEEIAQFFPGVPLFDDSFAVAKEVMRQLEKNHVLNMQGSGKIKFIYSKIG